jgi:hypothetical protein
MALQTRSLLDPILADDALTRGLGDSEARILVEWLVDYAEQLAEEANTDAIVGGRIQVLCRRGRAISRFVALWTQAGSRGAAGQLAAAERFTWPLPSPNADPCEIMQAILEWETQQQEDKQPVLRD